MNTSVRSRLLPLARLLLPVCAMLLVQPDSPAAAQQAIDEEYTDQILEFTTEPFFVTPLVDHLPASATVPSPLDFFGAIAGAPKLLHYPEEVADYMRAVAAASPRVEVYPMGMSEEGREMILVAVGSEESIAEIEANKAALRALADPRRTPEDEARRLIQTTKPIYWSTGAIHSPETGSPEMFMELIYRLAVSEDPFIREIRDNLVFLNTPVVDVDGRAKQVDVHMAKHKDEDYNGPSRIVYWGKYVAHDNNRDNIGQGLALSRQVTQTFLEWSPTVFHDHHESASHLYTSTGRGPYNAWLDPIVINEWNRLAYKEVQDMTAFGVPGVYTHDFYDGWGANYMMWVAHMRNAIGRFYETQGAGDASTRIINTRAERQWHRPSPPVPQVVWSIRNNVNLQQSAVLIAMNEVANNREEFLHNFYLKASRSVAKARQEGPAAYVLPADAARPGQQARLLQLLQGHAFEIHQADRDFEVAEQEFAEGSYIVRMDQPYSRGADMLLDKQYYNPNDPSPYDDTGWTVGPLFDVETVRIEDPEVLDARMTLVTEPIRAMGGVEGRGEVYAIDYQANNRLTTFRYAHDDLNIWAARDAFVDDDDAFGAGSFLVSASDNPGVDLNTVLDEAGAEYGFTARAIDRMPDVQTTQVGAPRVAVVHTWTDTQNEGWLRMGLDEYAVPFDYLSVHDVRDGTDLAERYDVIVFGATRGGAMSILRGVQGEDPIPWEPSELTPNIGKQDRTSDIRGGLELSGILNLDRFVRAGGVLVTMAGTSAFPIHFGLASGLSVRATPDMWAPGGVYKANVAEEDSPITYGYGESLGVAFRNAPVFARGGGGFNFRGFANRGGDRGGPGSTTARRSGRGGTDETDIVQGRSRSIGEAGVEAFRSEHEEENESARPNTTSNDVRTVMSFESNVEELLISGGLRNGQPLAGAPALVDVKLDDGHVVLFSFNPFWRNHTHGSYALLFNTLLHHDNLDVVERPVVVDDGGNN